MDFINNLIENTEDKNLLQELFAIDENALKLCTDESPDGEDFVMGCTYGKGGWITDPDNRIIYKKEMPLFFAFLKDWYHF